MVHMYPLLHVVTYMTGIDYKTLLKPDIGKHPLDCWRHLSGARLINYRAI